MITYNKQYMHNAALYLIKQSFKGDYTKESISEYVLKFNRYHQSIGISLETYYNIQTCCIDLYFDITIIYKIPVFEIPVSINTFR